MKACLTGSDRFLKANKFSKFSENTILIILFTV